MVTVPGYQDSSFNLPDPFAILQGSSVKSISFSVKDQFGQNQSAAIGTSFEGDLERNVESQQQRDFDTNELLFWDDQKTQPRMQVVATVNTNYRDDEDDDGLRRFFFASGMLQALQQEMRDKKLPRFGVGTHIKVTLINLQPTKGYPKKIYNVELSNVQPWRSAEEAATEQALAPSQPAPQQQPVQGAQQAWAPSASAAPAPVAQAASQGQPVQQAVAQQPPAQTVAPQPAAPVEAPAAATEQVNQAGDTRLPDAVQQALFLIEQGVPQATAVTAAATKQGLGGDSGFLQAVSTGVESALV
jgi:hypothetical protein